MKRVIDVVVASMVLVIFSPLLAGIALLVRVRLGSPVLFAQQRPGRHARPFTMYKFRTMRDAVDSNGRPLADAERMTAFGARLRSLSLDELPELWNVVKGDMSLVGPRPLLMQYVPLYNAEQARRHEVRPGITGWAQINGRNAIDWEQKFALDVWYVDHRSTRVDMDILWRTLRAVIHREGISHGAEATMPAFTGSPSGNSEPSDIPTGPRTQASDTAPHSSMHAPHE